MARIWNTDPSNAEEDEEQLELLFIAGENENGTATLEDHLGSFLQN